MLLGVVGAFYFIYSGLSSPGSSPNFSTYNNSYYGFSLHYPKGLVIKETVPPKESPQSQVILFAQSSGQNVNDTESPLTIEVYLKDPTESLVSSGAGVDYITDSKGSQVLLITYLGEHENEGVSSAVVFRSDKYFLVVWFEQSLEQAREYIVKSARL